jgi:uncharacterized protein
MNHRVEQLKSNYSSWLFRNYGFQVFGMFLLGLFLVKKNVVQDISSNLTWIRTLWKITGAITVGAFLLFVSVRILQISQGTFWYLLSYEIEKINRTGLCLFYASSVVLLVQHTTAKKLLEKFTPAGRMALTNYLMQSCFWTAVFYGLGLYGGVSPAIGFLASLVFFVFQVILSRWWMSRFAFGPLEWLWRSLTYGIFQPIRKKPGST